MSIDKSKKRCTWCEGLYEDYVKYHDEEWGVPVHDDRKHFEFLILEGAQAGLSWSTILNRREGYRRAFADFDPEIVARYDEEKYKELCELLDKSHKDLEEMLQEANVGTLLVLGLGKVGKTTILERIRKQAFVNVRPTLTTQLFNMMIESYNFKVVDVSGQKTLRMQWWSYSKHPDAVLFVLDINDTGPRLEETKAEYKKLMARFEAEGEVKLSKETPILIFANKIDMRRKVTTEFSSIIKCVLIIIEAIK